MIHNREEVSREQVWVLQDTFEVVHRHHRYVGRIEQVDPLCGSPRFEDAGQFAIDRVDVRRTLRKGYRQ